MRTDLFACVCAFAYIYRFVFCIGIHGIQLEMWDQIRFYEVPEDELDVLRADFESGSFVPKWYNVEFNLEQYEELLKSNETEIAAYASQQRVAMDKLLIEDKESLQRLAALEGDSSAQARSGADAGDDEARSLLERLSLESDGSTTFVPITADVTSRVFQIHVDEGDAVVSGETVLAVLEAMKIEIPVYSTATGRVAKRICSIGDMCEKGDTMMVIAVDTKTAATRASHVGVIDLGIEHLLSSYASRTVTPRHVIEQIYDRMDAHDASLPASLTAASSPMATTHNGNNNAWISKKTREEVLAYVARHFESPGGRFYGVSPTSLPLYGIPFAVKDNIDVGGMETTAACLHFAKSEAETSAPCVQQLLDAGGIVIGKTNMDQFATGLVGTRSPYGECFNAIDPLFVSGGSSSGSAVTVALGFVSFALGTDTAGSGRVPAAMNGIVGLKPTCGRVSTRGSVPACMTLDCITVFAEDIETCEIVLHTMEGYDRDEPYSRKRPSLSLLGSSARVRPPPSFRFGVPRDLFFKATRLNPDIPRAFDAAYRRTVARFASVGGIAVEFDFSPFVEVASLVYGGPWVAERYATLAEVLATDSAALSAGDAEGVLHPVTRQVLRSAEKHSAADTFNAMYRLKALKKRVDEVMESLDVLLLPSLPTIYTREEVREDPIPTNSDYGYYTNYMNMLDFCGLALPTPELVELRNGDANGEGSATFPFSVTMGAPCWHDELLVGIAEAFTRAARSSSSSSSS